MTATVTRLITESLPTTPAQALALAVDGIVMALLIGLLVFRLVLSVGDRASSRPTIRILDVGAAPLLMVFAISLYIRLQEILPLG